MIQTAIEFNSHETQSELVLRLIRQHPGITNWQLASNRILNHTARISEIRHDLRKDGLDIRAERVFIDGKATGTWRYYLEDAS